MERTIGVDYMNVSPFRLALLKEQIDLNLEKLELAMSPRTLKQILEPNNSNEITWCEADSSLDGIFKLINPGNLLSHYGEDFLDLQRKAILHANNSTEVKQIYSLLRKSLCKEVVKLDVKDKSRDEILDLLLELLEISQLSGVIAKLNTNKTTDYINITHPLVLLEFISKPETLEALYIYKYENAEPFIPNQAGLKDELIEHYRTSVLNTLALYTLSKTSNKDVENGTLNKQIEPIGLGFDFTSYYSQLNMIVAYKIPNDINSINLPTNELQYALVPNQLIYEDIIIPAFATSLISYERATERILGISITPQASANIQMTSWSKVCSGNENIKTSRGLKAMNGINQKSPYRCDDIPAFYDEYLRINFEIDKQILEEMR